MRQLIAVVTIACVAACGRVTTDTEDAAATIDASEVDAIAIDAPPAIDARVDAPPCPDADGDTVCDTQDVCAGHDDLVDGDADTVPDGCDLCVGANDLTDTDSDGIPDRCPITVLVVDGFGSGDLAAFLRGWGMTVTVVPAANITAAYDFTPYDVIAVMFDSAPAAPAALVAAQNNGKGIVVHRGDSLVDDFGMAAAGYWQSDMFVVTSTSHFITQTMTLGALDLSYDYQSRLDTPTANARVLATGNGGVAALAVHMTRRTVVTPYYGHTGGMPWSNAGAILTWRSYVWASGRGAQ